MGKLLALLLLASFLAAVHSTCLNESRPGLLYPHMAENGDVEFPRLLDAKRRLDIQGIYKLLGKKYKKFVWIVPRGLIAMSHRTSIEWYFRPSNFVRNSTAFVAAAYSDIDLVAAPNDSHVWYRESTNGSDLDRFNRDMKRKFCRTGERFNATHLLIVTFQKVESFCDHFLAFKKRDVEEPDMKKLSDERKKLIEDQIEKKAFFPPNVFPANTFQIVYATNGRHGFVMFNYHSLCWFDCHTLSRAGFNNGKGHRYEIINSGTEDFGQNDQLSNVGVPGRFMYRVDRKALRGPDCSILN